MCSVTVMHVHLMPITVSLVADTFVKAFKTD